MEILLIGLLIGLIPTILYLLTLQNTLKAIRPSNRTMQPGEVWLQLIPLFNLVWIFIMINRISDSIDNECESRHISVGDSRPTYNVGIAYAICAICSVIPVLGILSLIAAFVLWIVYWVQVNNYKVMFQKTPGDILEQTQF